MSADPSDPASEAHDPLPPPPPAPASPPVASGLEATVQAAGAGHVSAPLTPLDSRAINYWRIHSLIGSCFLLAGLAVIGILVSLTLPEVFLLCQVVWFALLVFRVWWFFWFPVRNYRAWGFRVDDNVLETRHGICIRVITLLPLSRLQHVDLHRGPLERYFGLTSLVLQTAGTHNATITIPGLDASLAIQLRDQLIAAGGDDAV